MSLPASAMSDAVPGQDVEFDAPTLSELKAAHDWRTEERADGRYIVDVCQQCGHEESAARRGRVPDCEVQDVPAHLISLAKRHGLLPETRGAREDSMVGVPGQ